MASDSSKGFIIVEFQEPVNGTLKHVCVPKSWIICPIGNKKVCIVYPIEDLRRTYERLKKNEPPGQGWKTYIGEIIRETKSVRDAICIRGGIPLILNENIKQDDGESSKNMSHTPVTETRGSLKFKIRKEDIEWKSEKSENMKKTLKSHDKDKSNKHIVENMEKRTSKENFRNSNVNTENTFLGSINTPETTGVNQNNSGFEQTNKVKIKDIRYSSEPELKRSTLNKTNSVVSKANLSENVQKDVHMTFSNLSPSDRKLLVDLQSEQNESIEKIKNLELQMKVLFMKVNENKETLSQILEYQDEPLEAVPLEKRNDQYSNMNDDEMEAKEDNEEDDEELSLIYEEEEKKETEKEMKSESDADSRQSYSPPSSPELLMKNVRNNNRWTLKYKQPGTGLIQLGNSHVYLCASGLQRCKRTCRNVTTFVRELYKEVFTREALSTCSMTGKKPIFGRSKCPPALDCEAQDVILQYAKHYSQKVGWDYVDRAMLFHSIRSMLHRLRQKRNRFYEVKKS